MSLEQQNKQKETSSMLNTTKFKPLNIETIDINDFENAYSFVMENDCEKESEDGKCCQKQNIFEFFANLKSKHFTKTQQEKDYLLKDFDEKDFSEEFKKEVIVSIREFDEKTREKIADYLKYQKNLKENKLNKECYKNNLGNYQKDFNEILKGVHKLDSAINDHTFSIEEKEEMLLNIGKIAVFLNKENANIPVLTYRMPFLTFLIEKLEQVSNKKEQLFVLTYFKQELLILNEHIKKITDNLHLEDNETGNYLLDVCNELTLLKTIFAQKENVETKEKSKEEKVTVCNCQNSEEKQSVLYENKRISTLKKRYLKLKTDALYNMFLNTTIEKQYFRKDMVGSIAKMLLIGLGLLFSLEHFLDSNPLQSIIIILLTSLMAMTYFTPLFMLLNREWFVELSEKQKQFYEEKYKEIYQTTLDLEKAKVKTKFDLIHYFILKSKSTDYVRA